MTLGAAVAVCYSTSLVIESGNLESRAFHDALLWESVWAITPGKAAAMRGKPPAHLISDSHGFAGRPQDAFCAGKVNSITAETAGGSSHGTGWDTARSI